MESKNTFSNASVFSGVKISVAYSVTGAVLAEWVGAQEGLGIF